MLAEESPLALAMAIPTEQPTKLFFKPKAIYLAEKGNVLEEFPMRNLVKWAINREQFIFETKKKDGMLRSQTVLTPYAHICSSYLSIVQKLFTRSS